MYLRQNQVFSIFLCEIQSRCGVEPQRSFLFIGGLSSFSGYKSCERQFLSWNSSGIVFLLFSGMNCRKTLDKGIWNRQISLSAAQLNIRLISAVEITAAAFQQAELGCQGTGRFC